MPRQHTAGTQAPTAHPPRLQTRMPPAAASSRPHAPARAPRPPPAGSPAEDTAIVGHEPHRSLH
eukprot:1038221-Alexandrium_andersonii.AAC.1